MVKFLLEHGRHVLCEKPLCLDPEQAGELAHSQWVPFDDLVNNTFARYAVG